MLTLLSAATSASAAPSASDVIDAYKLGYACDQIQALVRSTAGSGTMTATVAIWAYFPDAARWYLVKSLNAGSAIAETSADAIQYGECVSGLRGASHVWGQLTAVAGTSTAITIEALPIPDKR